MNAKKVTKIIHSVINEDATSKDKILSIIRNSSRTWFSHGTNVWYIDHNLNDKGRRNSGGVMNLIDHELSRGLQFIKSSMHLNPDDAGYIDFTFKGNLLAKVKTVPPIDYNKGSVPYPTSRIPGPVGSVEFWLYLDKIDFSKLSDQETEEITDFIQSMVEVERFRISSSGW